MVATELLPAASPPTRSISLDMKLSKSDTPSEKAANCGVVAVEGAKEKAAVTEVDEADYPDGGLRAWLVVVGVCLDSIEG